MDKPRFSLANLLLAMALCAVLFGWWADHRRLSERATRVASEDLGRGVEVMGRLGHPLMEVITIRGRWFDRPRNQRGGMVFSVTEVNGDKLSNPVEFDRYLVRWMGGFSGTQEKPAPKDGDVWELQATEKGKYWGLPAVLYAPAPAPSEAYRGFHTELVYADYKRLLLKD